MTERLLVTNAKCRELQKVSFRHSSPFTVDLLVLNINELVDLSSVPHLVSRTRRGDVITDQAKQDLHHPLKGQL